MKQITFAALLLFLSSGLAQAQTSRRNQTSHNAIEAILIAKEKRSWEAARQKDYQTFADALADDFSDVFPNGKVVGKKELMENYIRGVNLIDYSLNKFKVVPLNQEAAIVVYEAVAHGSENDTTAHDVKKGEITAIHVAVTSAWARRRGRWLNVFYRENDIK